MFADRNGGALRLFSCLGLLAIDRHGLQQIASLDHPASFFHLMAGRLILFDGKREEQDLFYMEKVICFFVLLRARGISVDVFS